MVNNRNLSHILTSCNKGSSSRQMIITTLKNRVIFKLKVYSEILDTLIVQM